MWPAACRRERTLARLIEIQIDEGERRALIGEAGRDDLTTWPSRPLPVRTIVRPSKACIPLLVSAVCVSMPRVRREARGGAEWGVAWILSFQCRSVAAPHAQSPYDRSQARHGLIVLALFVILLTFNSRAPHPEPERRCTRARARISGLPRRCERSIVCADARAVRATHLEPGKPCRDPSKRQRALTQAVAGSQIGDADDHFQMYYAMPGALAERWPRFSRSAHGRTSSGWSSSTALAHRPSRRSGSLPSRCRCHSISFVLPLVFPGQGANRSHVRAIIVDGRSGTRGFGIAASGRAVVSRIDQWRDTQYTIEGAGRHAAPAAFISAWAEVTERLLTGDLFFPRATFDSIGR